MNGTAAIRTATSSIITPCTASVQRTLYIPPMTVYTHVKPRIAATPHPYGSPSTVSSKCAQPLAIPAMYQSVANRIVNADMIRVAFDSGLRYRKSK